MWAMVAASFIWAALSVAAALDVAPARADSFFPQQSTPMLLPMTSAGVLQNGTKVSYGIVSTVTGGTWSVDLTGMGCTATPVVIPQPISTTTALGDSATATTTAVSNTAVSGFVNLPNTIAVGGSPVQRAGANVPVHIAAFCK